MTAEHIKAFADIGGVRLSGIHSRTQSRAADLAERTGIPVVASSVEELYDRTKADLVVISVPVLAVAEVSTGALKYPWTCLIEKPAGHDIATARELVRNAERQKSAAFVGLNRRQYDSTRRIMEELQEVDGHRFVHVFDQQDQTAARAAGQPEEAVVNWMYANSIHLVDYLAVLGRGRITRVEPVMAWDPAKPSVVLAKVSYDSGDVGLYEGVWERPGPWAVTVTTPERRWELRPLEQLSSQARGSRKVEAAGVNERDVQFKPGVRAQAEEAVKAAIGRAHTLPSLQDAFQTMRLVQAIYGQSPIEL